MRSATVTLAIDTALDIGAARRLHDYGDLDDRDVQRALEQVVMQRIGRIDWPAPLSAICHIAAVIEQGDAVSILDIRVNGDESDALSRFFARWPQNADTIVAWQADPAALIAVRAFMHERVVPTGLHDARRIALHDVLNPANVVSAVPEADLEADLAVLTDGVDIRGEADCAVRIRATAVNRYRWWLRWQHCQGRIDNAALARRKAALAAREKAPPVSV